MQDILDCEMVNPSTGHQTVVLRHTVPSAEVWEYNVDQTWPHDDERATLPN